MKFSVTIKPAWHVSRDGEAQLSLPGLLALLAVVDELGQIEQACTQLGVSYRHGWGLLRTGEEVFGSPLVSKARGRGTTLTPLGKKLLWADKRIAARLAPTLDSLASELEAELLKSVEHKDRILRINASHGFAVETLRGFLVDNDIPVDLKYRGSLDSVASLARGDCDVAGFHVPLGEFESAAWAQYRKWLRPRKHRLIHLAERQQGLFVLPGNPKGIRGLEDLTREDVSFVNRQPGSGTRILLDLLLEARGLHSDRIRGFQNSELTHAAVAAYIASGMADVGFGVRTAAHRFKLDFIEIARERYFIACNASALRSAAVRGMVDIMQREDFRAAVSALPGYDGTDTGRQLTPDEAVPPT
ncbi:MAG: helix-turn-helix transcriptional regulator [Pseudazoarcus pumilus]|nr:helix-turn-helix transcriptional regulator [Pseudazoarcus pumilus]